MPSPRKFSIAANGSDAITTATFEEYRDAEAEGKRLSVGHWLGFALFGPSGKIATYWDGRTSGYKDGTTGAWHVIDVGQRPSH